jgi:glutamate 5-kinase
MLVLLSDVDGLYDRNPTEAGALVLPRVTEIDESVLALAHGGNGRGRGGMISKLMSARIVLEAGKTVIIANGRAPHVLERVLAGEAIGTRFSMAGDEVRR